LGEFVDPSGAAGFQRDLEAMTSAAVDELCRNTAEQRRTRIVAAAWPASTSAASVIESVYWRR
jgi:hydroxymethylpyrimidine/phosphomethylpyrimidine kinase